METARRILCHLFVSIAATILGGPACPYVWAQQRPHKPNVVVIIVDSMGYGDSDAYGAPDVRLPSLNRLGREGVLLTDGYANGPVCFTLCLGLIS